MTQRRWLLLVAGLILMGIAIAAAFPYEREVVGSWEVTVQDTSGHPLQGVLVAESWEDYDMDRSALIDALTDKDGRASFKAETWRGSMLRFAVIAAFTRFDYGVHAGSGITASVDVDDRRAKDRPSELCWYEKCRGSHRTTFAVELQE